MGMAGSVVLTSEHSFAKGAKERKRQPASSAALAAATRFSTICTAMMEAS